MCSIGMMTAIRFGTNRSKHCLQIDINSRKIDNVGYILIYKLMTLQTDIKCLYRYAYCIVFSAKNAKIHLTVYIYI